MKKMLIVVIGIMLVSNISFGQKKFVPHVKGDKAVLFSFNGLANLGAGSYQGGVGYKKFIKDKTAIRAMVDVYSYNEKISWGATPGWIGEDGSYKENRIAFDLGAEFHSNKGKVDPYYGGGFEFRLERTKYVEDVSAPQGSALPVPEEVKNELGGNAATRFEIYGMFGIEYTINTMITLAAEYQLRFNMEFEPDEVRTDASGVETSYDGSRYSYLSLGSVGFITLAIYLNR